MPANLPPEAKDKWAAVEAANNPKDKILRMQEFLSCVPQHKGTLKLRGQVKKKIAVLKRDLEERKRKGTGRSSGPKFFVEKEGAAQLALLGLTNVGKSSLLTAVTNAKVNVSPNPFTSQVSKPSIMNYLDVQFQVVEAPAIIEGSSEGKAWGPVTLGTARNADGLILMVDLSFDPVGQLRVILEELEKSRILVSKPKGKVDIERRNAGGTLRVVLLGKLIDCSMREVEKLLRSYRINDAVVKISGEISLDDIEDSIFESTIYKPAVIVANKLDLDGANEKLENLADFVGGKLPIIAISALQSKGLETLGEKLFESLNIIRVYTKEPSVKEHSPNPFALKRGATVQDLAKNIHGEFVKEFSFAKVWSNRLTFSPQRVGLNFSLDDGDIVEIHTK